jgi:hypothetical protein
MRFVHTAAALLISTGCVLAWAADARAQCHNYAPQWEGNWQVQLGNNSCTPLTGVTVTVAVTQEIVVASSTEGYNGFAMQLNANGASSGLTPSQLYWEQFVMMVGTKNLPSGQVAGVDAFSQQWSNGKQRGGIYPNNPTFMGAPSTVNDTLLTIPAGTTFTWSLSTDANDYVESCTFSAKDNIGTKYQEATEYIPAGDRAPIYSVTMDIVGYNDFSYTLFQSGAGTITYTAKSFSASYDYPSCARNTGTGENSDMGYGRWSPGQMGPLLTNFSQPQWGSSGMATAATPETIRPHSGTGPMETTRTCAPSVSRCTESLEWGGKRGLRLSSAEWRSPRTKTPAQGATP